MVYPTSSSSLEPQLVSAAERAIDLLNELPGRLDHGSVQHQQHVEMAERVRALSGHLQAALALARLNNYPSAFALLRVALEHHLVDELIFRGRHHRQIYWGVTAEMWAEWQADRAAGADWAADIVSWSRTEKRGGTVTILRRGLFSEPDESGKRSELSIYYFLVLLEYQPLRPPPAEAAAATQDHPLDADVAVRWSERSRDQYRWYLSWSAIRSSLLGEEFFTEQQIGQLDVHYRFLSTYVHPIANRTSATYGLNVGWPAYNRAAYVLCLLYVLTLASRELQDYLAMTKLEPVVAVVDGNALVADVDAIHRLSSLLWFPGQRPHQYDFNTTAQRDRMEAMLKEIPNPSTRAEPLYYTDPLRRIAGACQEFCVWHGVTPRL